MAGKLTTRIVGLLNQHVAEVCREAGVLPKWIYKAVVVGNTCMHHLLLGIDPSRRLQGALGLDLPDLAVAVPGEVAGLMQAFKQFGTLPLPVLVAPLMVWNS